MVESMSRIITFSRSFPGYHPKAGQPTGFVEKLMACWADVVPDWKMTKELTAYDWHKYYNCTQPKRHTIRAGHRWKPGDRFSPRVWSGKPYRSKQIILSEDIEIKKVWGFEIDFSNCPVLWINVCFFLGEELTDILEELAANDGLSVDDFKAWFKWGTPFSGQVICWDENVEY